MSDFNKEMMVIERISKMEQHIKDGFINFDSTLTRIEGHVSLTNGKVAQAILDINSVATKQKTCPASLSTDAELLKLRFRMLMFLETALSRVRFPMVQHTSMEQLHLATTVTLPVTEPPI